MHYFGFASVILYWHENEISNAVQILSLFLFWSCYRYRFERLCYRKVIHIQRYRLLNLLSTQHVHGETQSTFCPSHSTRCAEGRNNNLTLCNQATHKLHPIYLYLSQDCCFEWFSGLFPLMFASKPATYPSKLMIVEGPFSFLYFLCFQQLV